MRILLILFSLLFQTDICAQINNIRTDRYNLAHNSAILSNVLLHVFGNKKIEKWLEDNKHFIIFYETSREGRVHAESMKVHRSIYLNKKEIDSIANYIIVNDIRFPYCIEDDACIGFDRINTLVNKENKCTYNNTAFPGEGYYNELLLHNDTASNLVQLLQNSIEKYRIQTIRETIINNNIHITHDKKSDDNKSLFYDSVFYDIFDELNFMLHGIPLNGIEYIKSISERDTCLYVIRQNIGDRKSINSLSQNDIITYIKMLSLAYIHKYGRNDYFTLLCSKTIKGCKKKQQYITYIKNFQQ